MTELTLGNGEGRQFLYWRPEHGTDPKNCPYPELGNYYEWIAEVRMRLRDQKGLGLPVLTEPIEDDPEPPYPAGSLLFGYMRRVGEGDARWFGRLPTIGYPNGISHTRFKHFNPQWGELGNNWTGGELLSQIPLRSQAYEDFLEEVDEFFMGPLCEASALAQAQLWKDYYRTAKVIGSRIRLNRVDVPFRFLQPIYNDQSKQWSSRSTSNPKGSLTKDGQLFDDDMRRHVRFAQDGNSGDPGYGRVEDVYVASGAIPTPTMFDLIIAQGSPFVIPGLNTGDLTLSTYQGRVYALVKTTREAFAISPA